MDLFPASDALVCKDILRPASDANGEEPSVLSPASDAIMGEVTSLLPASDANGKECTVWFPASDAFCEGGVLKPASDADVQGRTILSPASAVHDGSLLCLASIAFTDDFPGMKSVSDAILA